MIQTKTVNRAEHGEIWAVKAEAKANSLQVTNIHLARAQTSVDSTDGRAVQDFVCCSR